MRRIRLVIADRRPVVLQGFASLFAAKSDFEVVASCLDGASCLEAVRNLAPDVVLVEDGFSDVTASEMLAVANAENLPSRLVFYTASVARGDVAAAIAAGACNAISMRAKPETVLQSLRLVAPRPDRAPAENGALGEDVLAVLTVEERKIMRLVAYGLSNKEIARQLNVPPGAIKADLNRIFQKLQIKNRTELAALALSRLSGGIGALAALIFAALDDVRAAHPNAVGHTFTDTFTVMAADGTAEVVTIVINPKKSGGASSATARMMSKAGRAENSATGTPTPTGKLVDSSADIAASTSALAALNSARPSSGSYSAFMMAAAAVLIYELDTICSPAQAFDLAKNLTDVFGSATANGTKELVTLNRPSSADTTLDGFDNLAWQNPEIYDRSFAFETSRGDTIATGGDEPQIVRAEAREDSGSRHGKDSSLHAKSDDAIDRSDTIHERSATVNVLSGDTIDRGGFGELATDTSEHAEHGTTPPGTGTIPIVVNRSAVCTLLNTAPQPPSSKRPMMQRETIPIMGNQIAICTLLKAAPQPPSSKPSMTHRETIPIMGSRTAICTLLKAAPQPPSSKPSMTHRETIPIMGSRTAICTLLKTAPQPPSSTPSMTPRETIPIMGSRTATCTRLKTAPRPPSSTPSMARHH